MKNNIAEVDKDKPKWRGGSKEEEQQQKRNEERNRIGRGK
jgi:hypothetical protein